MLHPVQLFVLIQTEMCPLYRNLNRLICSPFLVQNRLLISKMVLICKLPLLTRELVLGMYVNDYPNCATVEIVATFPGGGTLRGSGAFIGPKGILTAGHIVYQEDYGIAESITIYPGGSNSDYSPLEKDEIYISLDWYSKEKDDKDYAVITVTEKAGAGH